MTRPSPQARLQKLRDSAIVGSALAFLGSLLTFFVFPNGFAAAAYLCMMGLDSRTARGKAVAWVGFVLGLSHLFWCVPSARGLEIALGLQMDKGLVLATGVVFGTLLALGWNDLRVILWCAAATALATLIASTSILALLVAILVLHAGNIGGCMIGALRAMERQFEFERGLCPPCEYDCRSLSRNSTGGVTCPECGTEFAKHYLEVYR